MPIRRDRASGRFAGGAFGHEVLAKRHKRVYDWLRNKPFGTQQQYGLRLKTFCEAMKVTPEQFHACMHSSLDGNSLYDSCFL